VKTPLTVYAFIPRRHHIAYEYRVLTPLEAAKDLGLPIRSVIDTDDSSISPQEHFNAICSSDVAYLYQPISEITLSQVRQLRSIIPSKVNGDWKHPPAIVVDSDDNLFNVTPFNMAFRSLGYQDEDGKEIPRGSMIGTWHGGDRKVLWHDGPCIAEKCGNCGKGIDLGQNKRNLQSYRTIVDEADAFTCTTPHVLEAMRREIEPPRPRVFPNTVRFDHYPQLDLVEEEGKVKVFWQGGGAHWEDFYPLKDAMAEITVKYPQVHWIIWGALYHWVMELIPPDRYTFVNWVKPEEYRLRRVMFGEDINLAPLQDNRFNRCRSAIKFYEGSVCKKPAATLAQATGPYQDEMIEGETGLLFSNPKEFVDKLSLLVEDKLMRQTLAKNAKDWVHENRNAMREAPKLIQFFEELREQSKLERPHMPDEQWLEFENQLTQQEEAQANGTVQPELSSR
jgi:glycosyltransferase involved in cell wall biosynthesis